MRGWPDASTPLLPMRWSGRPLAVALVALGGGILLAPLLPTLPLLFAICAGACLLLLWFLRTKTGYGLVRAALLLMSLLLLGMARAQVAATPAPNDVAHYTHGKPIWTQGRVDGNVTRRDDGRTTRYTFPLACDSVWDYQTVNAAGGRLYVTVNCGDTPTAPVPSGNTGNANDDSTCPPFYGQHVWLRGSINTPPPSANPGGFDWQAHLARRGIFATLYVRDARDLRLAAGDNLWSPFEFVAAGRTGAEQAIRAHLAPDDAALLSGLLLGIHHAPTGQEDLFVRTGTIHLVYTSGLHVALVAALVLGIGRVLTVPRRTLNITAITLVWGYALFAGSGPATGRAALMLSLALFAPLVRRVSDPLPLWVAGAFGLLLVQPLACYDAGTQITFGTVGIMLLALPTMEQGVWPWEPGVPPAKAALRGLTLTFAGGVVAFVASAPLLTYHFNTLSPVAPLANLLLAPLSEVALLMGMLACCLGSMFSVAPLWATLALLLHLLRGAAALFAAIPSGAWSVASPPAAVVIFCYIVMGGLALYARQALRQMALRRGVATTPVVPTNPIVV